MDAGKEIIRAENVTKRFGELTAVDRVNYRLRENEVAGIIGSNGAGKTTFFNLLCSLASRMVSRSAASCARAMLSSGWSGLPQQLKAATSRSRASISLFHARRAAASLSSRGMSQWLVGA